MHSHTASPAPGTVIRIYRSCPHRHHGKEARKWGVRFRRHHRGRNPVYLSSGAAGTCRVLGKARVGGNVSFGVWRQRFLKTTIYLSWLSRTTKPNLDDIFSPFKPKSKTQALKYKHWDILNLWKQGVVKYCCLHGLINKGCLLELHDRVTLLFEVSTVPFPLQKEQRNRLRAVGSKFLLNSSKV